MALDESIKRIKITLYAFIQLLADQKKKKHVYSINLKALL